MNFDRRKLIPIPCHHPVVEQIAFDTTPSSKPEVIEARDTFGWLLRMRSEDEVHEAIAAGWREFGPPLRQWTDAIDQVAAIYDHDNLVVGIYIHLGKPLKRHLLQQAPIPRDHCKYQLQQILGASSDTLVNIFSAAPGITHLRRARITIAPPHALEAPMETMADSQYGCTISECIHHDTEVFTADHNTMEFISFLNIERRSDWIVLGRDATPYGFFQEITQDLTELETDPATLLRWALVQPDEFYSLVQAVVFHEGRHIPWYHPGRAAWQAYESLDLADRAAVWLTVARWMFAGRDDSPIWNIWEHILDACCEAVMHEKSINPRVAEQARSEAKNFRTWSPYDQHHRWTYALLFFSSISKCIEHWNESRPALPYPHFPLLDGVTSCEPVYEKVTMFIEKLGVYKKQAGSDSAARKKLLQECR